MNAFYYSCRKGLAGILKSTGLCRKFSLSLEGFRLRFFPTSMSKALWINPHHYDEELVFYKKYLREGDTVLDVGANIGMIALLSAKKTGESGKVWTIEADPQTYARLCSNMALNPHLAPQITPLHYALGEKPGNVSILSHKGDDSQNRVNPEGPGGKIPMETLDRLFPQETFPGPLNLLKIDVEGFELPVLRGGRDLLRRTRCVLFEVSRENYQRYGYTPQDVAAFFKEQNFLLFRMLPQENFDSPLRLARAEAYEPPHFENLIALPPEEVASFCERTGFSVEEKKGEPL